MALTVKHCYNRSMLWKNYVYETQIRKYKLQVEIEVAVQR